LRAWRIGRGAHAVYDGAGAGLVGGRWNPVGRPVIYAAETYALALLEVLVHAQAGAPPPNCRYVGIEIPDDISREVVDPARLPGWEHPDYAVSQRFGADWIGEARSAVLAAPSVVSPPDRIVVINPAHPDAARIVASEEQPLAWEPRLARLLGGQ
jgi:RES domain-containing protein